MQLWNELRSALRIIVIDESYQRRGLGKKFLADIEKLLKEQGKVALHVQSSPEAYPFYAKQGYHKMPFNDPEEHESSPQDIDMGKTL